METTFPVDGSLGNKFTLIYNHCTNLWRPEVARRWKTKFLKGFCRKMTPYTGEFPKFCSKSIHRDIGWRVVFKSREIWPTATW